MTSLDGDRILVRLSNAEYTIFPVDENHKKRLIRAIRKQTIPRRLDVEELEDGSLRVIVLRKWERRRRNDC